MIDLYTSATPNGWKIAIMLEELGEPYAVRFLDLGKGDQFNPDFLAIAPNNKIPAIVDNDPIGGGGSLSIFESGAILIYLSEKHGRFLPSSGPERWRALEWLQWQVSALGPILGQLGYFALRAPENVSLAVGRFTEESGRLFNVLDRRLAQNRYLAGEDYSVADMASYPWVSAAAKYFAEPLAEALKDKPNMDRWLDEIGDRPAVSRGMHIPEPIFPAK